MTHRITPLALGLLAVLLTGLTLSRPSVAQAAHCEARSGARTAALVELYTSEGCSSCPPADQQLMRLRQALDPDASVVPLALHVDYWDDIGWKDPFAQPAFGQRHRALVTANQQRTVYTPHFFVSGGELRDWRGGLRDEVRRVNAQPAAADLRLQAMPAPHGTLTVSADASSRSAEPARLYLALTEDGLSNRVVRGENRGSTLAHDAVVRRWIGPVAVPAQGQATLRRDVALEPGWNRQRLSLVAFVQQERGARVLQALTLPAASGSDPRCASPVSR